MRMTAASTPATRPRRGRPGRPAVVAASLSELRGPADGTIGLPLRLFWSAPDHTFDLSLRHDALAAYESVLNEARTPADLAEFLNGGLLAELWGELHLPARVRQAWEDSHPVLRAGAHVSAAAPAA
jgi:hypothetical protein